ncbi:malectin [Eurytemora carolleeae]|uniref:malectin n=1 Tax=Eurytemora carolleeae TaxID=1294199 RepID=UPI000C760FB2|nr:malectin [Eurytemora carolleeae]|eukprot:XP_023340142.1 malectin-like [Eurytemora affinis]
MVSTVPLLGVLLLLGQTVGLGDIIYAVNCGGEAHTDIFGVHYEKDTNKVGVPSDYGKQLMIGRIPQQDQILYQTERYNPQTFGYDMPVSDDGNYLLVLKMSEVYFNAPNMKVFDVVLNGDLTVVSDLDIFERVGRGVAHDEYIEFEIEDNKILYQGEESEIRAGMIRVEFIKSYRDNPKINAIALMKGKLEDWPQLAPLPLEPEEEEINEDLKESTSKRRNPSGPRVNDPYAEEDSSFLLPVFVAIGAFIPILVCLCKI